MEALVRFLDLLLASLLVGTMVGIWYGLNPAGWSAAAYVEVQQHLIAAFNAPLPLIGAACILLTFLLAVLNKKRRGAFYAFALAALCLVIAGVVTRFFNQPINVQMLSWRPDALPPNWEGLRDQWWEWHAVRTASGAAGLCLLIVGCLSERGPRSRF